MIRASGASTALAEKIDPGNELLWRMRLRRLEAEVVRDAILTVSGDLDRKAGRTARVDPRATRRHGDRES